MILLFETRMISVRRPSPRGPSSFNSMVFFPLVGALRRADLMEASVIKFGLLAGGSVGGFSPPTRHSVFAQRTRCEP